MSAPMVVANWINLQYFGSVARPDIFGAGNKLLHSVVGGNLGVIEGGNGGSISRSDSRCSQYSTVSTGAMSQCALRW